MRLYLKTLQHEIIKQRMLLLYFPLLISGAIFIIILFSLYQTVHAYNFSNETLLKFANFQGIFPILNDHSIQTTEFNQWFGVKDRIEFLFLFFSGVIFITGGMLKNELHNRSTIFYSLLPINPYLHIINKLVISFILFPVFILLIYLSIKLILLLFMATLFTDNYTLMFWSSFYSVTAQQFNIMWITILYALTFSPVVLVIIYATIHYKNIWAVVSIFSIILLTVLERMVLGSEFLWDFSYNAFLNPIYHLWLEVDVQPFEVIQDIYKNTETYVGFIISAALVMMIQKSMRKQMFSFG